MFLPCHLTSLKQHLVGLLWRMCLCCSVYLPQSRCLSDLLYFEGLPKKKSFSLLFKRKKKVHGLLIVNWSFQWNRRQEFELLLKLGFIFVSAQPLQSYPAPRPSHCISIAPGENWNEIKMWATDGDNQWVKRGRERERETEGKGMKQRWKRRHESNM